MKANPYPNPSPPAIPGLGSADAEEIVAGPLIFHIMTSNKSFADWGEVFGDPVIATAILNRLLHHSHVVNIRGESYRLKEKRRAGLYTAPQPNLDRPSPNR